MAHTKGPWIAKHWRVCAGVEPGDRISVICDTATRKVARTEENKANAHLIAASPSLLAVCQEYIAYREGSNGNIDEIAARMKEAITLATVY